MKKNLVALVFFFVSFVIHAQPSTVSIQGILKDSAGNKLNGSYVMTFNFYDSENSTQPVYSFTPSEKVEVVNGLFNIYIDVSAQEIFKNYPNLYLGVKVEQEPEFPKIKIVSTGYAIHSKYADDLLGAATDVSCNGCIGTNDLADQSVTGIKIKDNEITDSKIASVSWSKITDIPQDIADGDNDTTYSAGDGITITDTTISLADNYKNGAAFDERFVNVSEVDSISTEMIKNGAVTNDKIASVSWSKISDIPADIADGDNVGIDGSGTAGYVPKFSDQTTLTNSAIFEKNGNVGIGTDNPQSLLSLLGSDSDAVGISVANSTQGGRSLITFSTAGVTGYSQLGYYVNKSDGFLGIENAGYLRSSGQDLLVLTSTNNSLYLGTNNQIRAYIDKDGNIGIGTVSPETALDVKGKVTADSFNTRTYEVTLSDTSQDLGTVFGELLQNYDSVKVTLAKNHTFVWNEPLSVGSGKKLVVVGEGYENGASNITVTINMTQNKTYKYGTTEYRDPRRVTVYHNGYFSIQGVKIQETSNDSRPLSPAAGSGGALFNLGSGDSMLIFSQLFIYSTEDVIGFGSWSYGQLKMGWTYIYKQTNPQSIRNIYAVKYYCGWSFSGGGGVVSNSHTTLGEGVSYHETNRIKYLDSQPGPRKNSLIFLSTPLKVEFSFTNPQHFEVSLPDDLPSGITAILADVFVTINKNDHNNIVLGNGCLDNQKNWVNTRGTKPSSEFGNIMRQCVTLTYPGEADGFTSNYGLWYSSQIIPVKSNKKIDFNNYSNSQSSGWVYIRIRGYFK